jgi:probable addiction module antidote protein
MKKKTIFPPTGGGLDETIIKALKEDEGFRREYLNDLLHEQEVKMIALSLRPLVEALGGIGKLSQKTGMGRQSLYKSLSGKVRPDFPTLLKIINYAGYDFSVDKKKTGKHRTKTPVFA